MASRSVTLYMASLFSFWDHPTINPTPFFQLLPTQTPSRYASRNQITCASSTYTAPAASMTSNTLPDQPQPRRRPTRQTLPLLEEVLMLVSSPTLLLVLTRSHTLTQYITQAKRDQIACQTENRRQQPAALRMTASFKS